MLKVYCLLLNQYLGVADYVAKLHLYKVNTCLGCNCCRVGYKVHELAVNSVNPSLLNIRELNCTFNALGCRNFACYILNRCLCTKTFWLLSLALVTVVPWISTPKSIVKPFAW